MPIDVLGHIKNLGLLRLIYWELTHVSIISLGHPEHSSIQIHSSIRLSFFHATAYILDSGCIIRPPTHGLDCPVLSLKDTFQRKMLETARLVMLVHPVTHVCFIG